MKPLKNTIGKCLLSFCFSVFGGSVVSPVILKIWSYRWAFALHCCMTYSWENQCKNYMFSTIIWSLSCWGQGGGEARLQRWERKSHKGERVFWSAPRAAQSSSEPLRAVSSSPAQPETTQSSPECKSARCRGGSGRFHCFFVFSFFHSFVARENACTAKAVVPVVVCQCRDLG